MNNLDKYVKDLTKFVNINEKALKISEKGFDLEKDAHFGFYLPTLKTLNGDALVGLEINRFDPDSPYPVIFWRITEDGFEMIDREDSKFEVKAMEMCKDMIGKRLYTCDLRAIYKFFRNCANINNVVDLREKVRELSLEISRDDFPVVWDPLPHNEISNAWENGDKGDVKIHSLARALKTYIVYIIVKNSEVLKTEKVININTRSVRRKRRSNLIKLP